MPFRYEHDMVEPAIRWLQGQGLMVKREFPTPWGICDLVGCSLNKSRAEKRLRLRQTRPISSQLRVHVLSLIPDQEDQSDIGIGDIVQSFGGYLDRSRIELEIARLIRDHFVEETSPGRFFKQNGWMPLHRRLVAVELKLTRVDDALHQAINNLGFADESYVALPWDTAERLLRSAKIADFDEKHVGILAVAQTACKVVSRPAKHHSNSQPATIQAYSVERFWLPFLRGSEA